jgi:hypothetical protein
MTMKAPYPNVNPVNARIIGCRQAANHNARKRTR